MIERIGLGLAACIAASGALAQAETKSGGEQALQEFLASVQTFSARFEQEVWSADQRLLETGAGELSLKRPNRFRWHSHEPFEQLMIADGGRLWMYDVELEQATVAPLDETAGPSPALLLSGDQSVRDSFNVTDEFTFDGLDWVRLEPDMAGGDFTAVLVGFRDGELELLELVDGLDQVHRFRFFEPVVNAELDDALFSFEPPPGVDVLGFDR